MYKTTPSPRMIFCKPRIVDACARGGVTLSSFNYQAFCILFPEVHTVEYPFLFAIRRSQAYLSSEFTASDCSVNSQCLCHSILGFCRPLSVAPSKDRICLLVHLEMRSLARNVMSYYLMEPLLERTYGQTPLMNRVRTLL